MGRLAAANLCLLTSLFSPIVHSQDSSLSPARLQAALAAKPVGSQAEALAARVREYFGKENLIKGTALRTEDLLVAWGYEAAGLASMPKVVSEDGKFEYPLQRIGESSVYAGVAYLSWGQAFRWTIQIDTARVGGGSVEVYTPHPDSLARPDVSKGTIKQRPKWQSKIFEGTTRDWWTYVPSQYTPDNPACVMIFQDGERAKDYVPVVFDNLIAKDDMPVTVGIFISPGVFQDGRRNRSFEYDTLSNQYGRFLLEEILPEVEKSVKLRHDARSRAIAGISSGGICAFTVAWEFSGEFSKVLSWVGSFANISSGKTLREGGHNYPALIRKTPPKAIRVFLQDGQNDLDNAHGNWPLGNLQMAKALAFAGYDYQFVYGNGFHNDRHGRAILPDSLRWLWRPE